MSSWQEWLTLWSVCARCGLAGDEGTLLATPVQSSRVDQLLTQESCTILMVTGILTNLWMSLEVTSNTHMWVSQNVKPHLWHSQSLSKECEILNAISWKFPECMYCSCKDFWKIAQLQHRFTMESVNGVPYRCVSKNSLLPKKNQQEHGT